MFLDALSISNLDSYLSIFPLLSTIYIYLRSFAVAITAIIAGKTLATFALGSIDNGNVKDSPVIVLMKTFAAVALIYWGGYVLEYIVYLGSIPYDAFLGINAVTGVASNPEEGLVMGLVDGLALASGGVLPVASLGYALVELFILIIIGWNLCKLVLEVCERWLMVGVLLFTSPLAYSTMPSNDTSQIFRRWVSMFIGAVLQMSLSVMFLKIILSGFNGSSTNFMLKLLMILAMCKIAQRVDSYLQQIGIGAPTTGGNMLDDIVAGYHAMKSVVGKRGGSGADGESGSHRGILGSLASRTNFGAAVGAATSSFKNSKSFSEAFRAGSEAYQENYKHTGVGRATQAYAEAKRKEQEYYRRRASAGGVASSSATGAAGKLNAAVSPKQSAGQKPAGTPPPSPTGQKSPGQVGVNPRATAVAGATGTDGKPAAGSQPLGKSPSPLGAQQAGVDGQVDHSRVEAAAKAAGERTADQTASHVSGVKYNAADTEQAEATYKAGMAEEPYSDDVSASAKAEGEAKANESVHSLGAPVTEPGEKAETGSSSIGNGTETTSPPPQGRFDAAKAAFVEGVMWSAFGTGDRPVAEDPKEAEMNSLANKEASSNDARRFQNGQAPLSDNQRTEVAKWRNDDPSRLGNVEQNQARHGVADEKGRVMTLTPEDDKFKLTDQAVLSGLDVATMPDESKAIVGSPNAVAEYLARSTDQGAFTTDGSRSYAAIPNRADYFADNMSAPEVYQKAGAAAAEEARKTDQGTIREYQQSMPETKSAIRDVEKAEHAVETLKSAGASPDRVEAAEREYQAAEANLHAATVAAGTARVAEAKERLDSLDRAGTPHTSAEYKEAAAAYQSSSGDLADYQTLHGHDDSYYANMANEEAENARAADTKKISDSYKQIKETAKNIESATIATSSAYEKAAALSNPNYHPMDCDSTRQMAYDVFGHQIPDMKAGMSVQHVKVVDQAPSANNAGGFSNEGGRSITIDYAKKDGSTGSATFFNATASTALPANIRRELGVYQAPDGSLWGVIGDGAVPGKRTVAPSRGTQVRNGTKVIDFFNKLSKKRR